MGCHVEVVITLVLNGAIFAPGAMIFQAVAFCLLFVVEYAVAFTINRFRNVTKPPVNQVKMMRSFVYEQASAVFFVTVPEKLIDPAND